MFLPNSQPPLHTFLLNRSEILLEPSNYSAVQSSYTGVYARGGPSSIDAHQQLDLGSYLSRSDGDVGKSSSKVSAMR